MSEEKGYEVLDHITWADVAFKATGKHLNDLFQNAAVATMAVMVELDTVESHLTQTVDIEEEDLEHLLFAFLSEIVYYKDADQMVFNKFHVSVSKQNDKWVLHATMEGEKIDPVKHTLGTDVKAITLHQFEIKKTEEGYECTVVVDV